MLERNAGVLAGFFKQAQAQIAALDHVLGDFEVAHALVAWQVIHQVEHELFEDHAQTAGTHLAGESFLRYGANGLVRKVQADVFILEQTLVLLENRVLRLGKNFDQRALVELIENAHDRKTADELGDQAILDEILRFSLAQQFGIAMRASLSADRLQPQCHGSQAPSCRRDGLLRVRDLQKRRRR